jgi:hypothetical protein
LLSILPMHHSTCFCFVAVGRYPEAGPAATDSV